MIGFLSYNEIKEIEIINKMKSIENIVDVEYLKDLMESANRKVATLQCRQSSKPFEDIEQLQKSLRANNFVNIK